LKKQSQFIRIAYCVLRTAKRNLKKQSQFDVPALLKGVEKEKNRSEYLISIEGTNLSQLIYSAF